MTGQNALDNGSPRTEGIRLVTLWSLFADIGMDRPAGQFIWIYFTDSC